MGHLLRSTPRYQKTFTPDKMGLHDLHLACVWLAGIFDQFHRQGGRVDSNVYTKIHQKKPFPSNLRCDIWTTKLNLHLGIKELQHWDGLVSGLQFILARLATDLQRFQNNLRGPGARLNCVHMHEKSLRCMCRPPSLPSFKLFQQFFYGKK